MPPIANQHSSNHSMEPVTTMQPQMRTNRAVSWWLMGRMGSQGQGADTFPLQHFFTLPAFQAHAATSSASSNCFDVLALSPQSSNGSTMASASTFSQSQPDALSLPNPTFNPLPHQSSSRFCTKLDPPDNANLPFHGEPLVPPQDRPLLPYFGGQTLTPPAVAETTTTTNITAASQASTAEDATLQSPFTVPLPYTTVHSSPEGPLYHCGHCQRQSVIQLFPHIEQQVQGTAAPLTYGPYYAPILHSPWQADRQESFAPPAQMVGSIDPHDFKQDIQTPTTSAYEGGSPPTATMAAPELLPISPELFAKTSPVFAAAVPSPGPTEHSDTSITSGSDDEPAMDESWDSREKDEFLLQARAKGWTYKKIKDLGGFMEAESTLRGRYRSLTKPLQERVRHPKWQARDIRLLTEAVDYLQPRGATTDKRRRMNGVIRKNPDRMPWKKVADFIVDRGGSYRFGYLTCRRKWLEISED